MRTIRVFNSPGHVSQVIRLSDPAPMFAEAPRVRNKIERHAVGDQGYWIEAYVTGNDGRTRWSVHNPDGATMALIWDREKAEAAALELAETGKITR